MNSGRITPPLGGVTCARMGGAPAEVATGAWGKHI